MILDESTRENRYLKKYSFVCMNMCAPCVHRSLRRSEEAYSGAEVTDGCVPPFLCCKPNPSPLQEQ